MREIPSESRLHLLPYASGVIGAVSSASSTARLQTMKTRQLHFIKWCLKTRIFDPTLSTFDIPQKNFIMACYTVSLTSNETVYCRTIKSATVNLYVSDAAKLAILNNKPDPTKNRLNQKSTYITNVINEHKRWESMPNRREPLTYSMVDHLYHISYNKNPPLSSDCLEAVLADWLILGMQTGMRKSEWCQDRYLLQKTQTVQHNRDGSSSAFIFEDFTFEGHRGYRIPNLRHQAISTAHILKLKWRFQKNGNNGEVLTYMCNASLPHRCPVQAAIRIRDRAIRLGVPPELPIAVFQNSQGKSQYIDDFHVTQILQFLARKIFNISQTNDLARFTCHSIRVGACVLLHETGQTPDFIKARLRWCSDAYQMYLRNTPKLASLHTQAVNASDS